MGSEGKSYIGSLRTKIEIYLEHWMVETLSRWLAACTPSVYLCKFL